MLQCASQPSPVRIFRQPRTDTEHYRTALCVAVPVRTCSSGGQSCDSSEFVYLCSSEVLMCGRGSVGVSIPAVCYMVFSVFLLACVGDTRAVFQALRGTFKLPMDPPPRGRHARWIGLSCCHQGSVSCLVFSAYTPTWHPSVSE